MIDLRSVWHVANVVDGIDLVHLLVGACLKIVIDPWAVI